MLFTNFFLCVCTTWATFDGLLVNTKPRISSHNPWPTTWTQSGYFRKTTSVVSPACGRCPASNKSQITLHRRPMSTLQFSHGAPGSPVLLCLKLAAQLLYIQHDVIIAAALCQLSWVNRNLPPVRTFCILISSLHSVHRSLVQLSLLPGLSAGGERPSAGADNGSGLADRRPYAGGEVCQSRLHSHFLQSSNPLLSLHRREIPRQETWAALSFIDGVQFIYNCRYFKVRDQSFRPESIRVERHPGGNHGGADRCVHRGVTRYLHVSKTHQWIYDV